MPTLSFKAYCCIIISCVVLAMVFTASKMAKEKAAAVEADEQARKEGYASASEREWMAKNAEARKQGFASYEEMRAKQEGYSSVEEREQARKQFQATNQGAPQDGQVPGVKTAAMAESPSPQTKEGISWEAIGALTGIGSLLLAAVAFWFDWKRRRDPNY